MSEPDLHFTKPPIVEAIVDIDCDLAFDFDLVALEGAARTAFGDAYAKPRRRLLHEFSLALKADEPPTPSEQHRVQALQFAQEDGKQLVQLRTAGFSFNRLAPYEGFDEYLPEIRDAWIKYCSLANPIKVQAIQLRYINRVFLPLENGRVELEEYFKKGPRLPDDSNLTFTGFLLQNQAIEDSTGYAVTTVLAAESPVDGKLPVIFDNGVRAKLDVEPDDWTTLESTLQGLRRLKNRVFNGILEDKCLNQFR